MENPVQKEYAVICGAHAVFFYERIVRFVCTLTVCLLKGTQALSLSILLERNVPQPAVWY
jgi:hypothetical protein